MRMLKTVKDYLKITWDDEDTHVQGIIDRGQAYLNDLTGTTLGFTTANLAQSLLLDYCRYVYNNASEYFEENYSKELLRLQLSAGVDELPVEVVSGET